MKCRHCGSELSLSLLDLGSAPPSNAYLTSQTLRVPEKWFPLRVMVCEECWLVQTEDFAQASELFVADYAYFSGFSCQWLTHCEQYVSQITERLDLGRGSHMVEVAANDGSLLQFAHARGIPCLGVEPTASTAASARAKGLEIIQDFFGAELARKLVAYGKAADLIVANNVLAHVPDINDFVAGFSCLLKPDGVATFEFPHLLRLLAENQFDTIYHEHYSYLSLTAVERIFEANGLTVFDVEELSTHGGSLRVYAQRADSGSRQRQMRVDSLLDAEVRAGMRCAEGYAGLQTRSDQIKDDFLDFLLQAKRLGKQVAAYGAAAKGNTLLNFAGVRPDLLHFVVDRNPAKQGKFLPGSRIPIVEESCLREARPDYVVILPWNLKEEVIRQLDYIRDWDAQFVTAVPQLEVV